MIGSHVEYILYLPSGYHVTNNGMLELCTSMYIQYMHTSAARVEVRQTERRSKEGEWPAKGASNPAIGQNVPKSHIRGWLR